MCPGPMETEKVCLLDWGSLKPEIRGHLLPFPAGSGLGGAEQSYNVPQEVGFRSWGKARGPGGPFLG